ncbi:MAG: sodium:solute symporter family protein [Methanomassiliicoccus sp.]|nr:sodium:solute symporter family protein [Methanomassiliicoccus sp.]
MVDTTTFWAFTILYVAMTLFLGYLGYRRTKASEDFMLAGRHIHPWIIGLSYGATFISTSAIVGFGGTAALYGMGLIWLAMLNISVGVLLAFVVFGKRTRKLGIKLKAVTFPDLLGKRFNSPFMQYASAVLILIAMPLYAAAVLIGGSRFVETTLGVNFNLALIAFAAITAIYVTLGGLKAVMYTDAMQGIIMIVGMTVLLLLTFSLLGGVTTSFTNLSNLSTAIPPSLTSKGLTSWTAFPTFGSEIWLMMVTTIIMGVGIGVLAQPQLVVRFMTAKDSKALNQAIPIGALFILLTTGVAYTVGPLTNVYFNQTVGKIAIDAAGGNVDNIMPLFISSAMPDLFVVIFMLVLLAAAMSTLSAIFHTMGTTAGFDLWSHVKRARKIDGHAKPSLNANKAGTFVMIVVSVVLAFYMPTSIIARATAMFMGLCACAFLPAFVHGLFSKSPSALAAKLSLGLGGITWFFWTFFVHIKESSILGICNFLFGQNAILGMPWQVVDPLVIALPVSIIALVAGILYDRMSSKDEVKTNGRAGAD